MEIKKKLAATLKEKPQDESKLGFGHIFTDHMLIMPYDEGQGWHDPEIVPYDNISLSPAAMCFHYGQTVFEGLKAYHGNRFFFHTHGEIFNQIHKFLCFRGSEDFQIGRASCRERV